MKTKIVGVLMIVVAISNVLIDLLSGSFNGVSGHFNDLILGFNGAGFYFMRDAIQKLTDLIVSLTGYKLSDLQMSDPKMDKK